MNPLQSHPNTSRSIAGTTGGGIVVWIANKYLGFHLNVYDGIAVAGVIGGFLLFIGRDGLIGAWRRLLHGQPKP